MASISQALGSRRGILERAKRGTRGVVDRLREDVTSIVERDPAARNRLEVALLYPGLHAIWAHRVSHHLWNRGAKFPARAISQATRAITGVEIHPGAVIGPRVFIDHGMGVVIGETARVGADVTIYHGVTLGGTTLNPGKRHPTIGDRVTLGAGAQVLGNLVVGDDSRIGANAVLVRTVDPHSVVVGVPGQVIAHGTRDEPDTRPKQDVFPEPDPVGIAVRTLLTRVENLEKATGHTSTDQGLYRTSGDVWETEDFSI